MDLCREKNERCVRGFRTRFLVEICGTKFACVLWFVKRMKGEASAGREVRETGVPLCAVRNRNWPVLRAGEAVSTGVVGRQ